MKSSFGRGRRRAHDRTHIYPPSAVANGLSEADSLDKSTTEHVLDSSLDAGPPGLPSGRRRFGFAGSRLGGFGDGLPRRIRTRPDDRRIRIRSNPIVDAMNKVFGPQRDGFRANHAKGIVVEGSFKASPEAAALSRAVLFNSRRRS